MSNQNAQSVVMTVKILIRIKSHGETSTVANAVTKSNKFKALQYAAPFLIPPEYERDIENHAFVQKSFFCD